MKTYKDMADEVFRIGDERIKANKSRQKTAAAVLSVAAVTVLTVAAWQSGMFKKQELKPEIINENTTQTDIEYQKTTDKNHTEQGNQETQPEEKYAPVKPAKKVPDGVTDSDGLSGGGTYGGIMIPAFPSEEGINYTGERLTDSEAKAYFNENKASIVSSLASSGVKTDKIVISEKGYSHALYNGTEGKQLEVRLNFRDYLVYNGDEIVSIITLWKEDGKIYNSPAFGAPWFGDYTEYLEQHKGEELVYVYAGMTEIIVSPDGSCHNPLGHDCSEYVRGIDNLYSRLYCPEIVYIP